jgi:hypothetical protein
MTGRSVKGKAADRRRIDPGQGPSRPISVDDRRDPGIGEAAGQGDRADIAGLGPALDRDMAVPRVDADNDRPG